MRNIFLGIWFIGIIYCQCYDYNQFQCSNDQTCEWIENVNYSSCSNFSQGQCNQYDSCSWTLSYGGGYGQWSYSCSGSYEVDNSFCQEIQMPECSEMNQLECNNNDYCEWELDIAYETCGQFSAAECNSVSGCYWDCSSWYTWICGCYGAWESDDSYCDELEYLNGDINFDWTINVLDIVELVDIILSGNSYIPIGDTNSDGVNNVLDVILLVSLIIGD